MRFGSVLKQVHEEGKSSIIFTTPEDDSQQCVDQTCILEQTSMSPVERYLQLRKLHSCGCPTKEIDFENLDTVEKLETGVEYCIKQSLVLYVLVRAFPWYENYKSDGYDLIEAVKSIFRELRQEMQNVLPNQEHEEDVSIPAHKFFEHKFIRHWISSGLTFSRLPLSINSSSSRDSE